MAGGAGHQLEKLLQLLAHRFAAGVAQLALQDRQDAFKRPLVAGALAIAAVGLNGDRLLAAMQQHLLLLSAELIPRRLDLKLVRLPNRIKQGEVIGIVLISPRCNRRINGQGGIGQDPLGGELAQVADAVAVGAGAVGAVEGEQPRRKLLHYGAVHRAGEIFRIEPLPLHPLGQLLIGLGHHLHQRQTIAPFKSSAQRIGQPLLHPLAGHKPVHHHLNVVGVVFI